MAKEHRPAMLFYGREFYGDINVMAMTLEERGAYVHLCWLCWSEGSVPDDASVIARIVQPADSEAFAGKSFPKLRACFEAIDGRLTHRKVEKIRAEVTAFSENQSERAKRGWEKRRNDAGSMPDECRNDAGSMPPISDLRSPISDLQTVSAKDICTPGGAQESPATSQLRKQQSEWFSEWYTLYPRKQSKGRAEKAYRQHVKSKEQADALMDALRKQLPELLSRAPEYVAYPASYLNSLAWLDEASPAKQSAIELALQMIEEEKNKR